MIEKSMLREVLTEIKRLDTSGDTIKVTVKNMQIINSITKKLGNIIMTDKYISSVKGFVETFDDVTRMQNEYWKMVDSRFKPKTILREMRKQSIEHTVDGLTQAGIGANITEQIKKILRTNITTGGSYDKLTNQLRNLLTTTDTSQGLLTRYAGQITTDAINQYNAQYTQLVSSGLGYEWYAYLNSDIMTTRPFCDAMTDKIYFHVSEIPGLLRAEDLNGKLTYVPKDSKGNQRVPVPLYDKTGLPQGMIEGTNSENFLIYRGGYRCRHSIHPVSEIGVPANFRQAVYASLEYQRWKDRVTGTELGYAPYRAKNVNTLNEDTKIRDAENYKLYQNAVADLAAGLGVKIQSKLDTWGGYIDSETKQPVQEVSNVINIDATGEIAELMAAIMGKIAPETQDSVVVAMHKPQGNGLEYTIKTGSFENALAAINLKMPGIEYFSINKKNGDIILIDTDNSNRANILNFINTLQQKNIYESGSFSKIQAEFVGHDKYDEIINRIGSKISTEEGFYIDTFINQTKASYQTEITIAPGDDKFIEAEKIILAPYIGPYKSTSQKFLNVLNNPGDIYSGTRLDFNSLYKNNDLEATYSNISKLEAASLFNYVLGYQQYDDDDWINVYLVKKSEGEVEADKFMDALTYVTEQSLQKLPEYEGTVYRGISLEDKFISRYKAAFETGNIITEPAFISTSLETRFYDGWNSGNTHFIIISNHGRIIRDFSSFASQEEIVFAPNSKFKVTEFKRVGLDAFIKMEEL